MKIFFKANIVFIFIFLFLLSSCEESSVEAQSDLAGTWIVKEGTTTVKEGTTDITSKWTFYSVTFSSNSNYTIKTVDKSGNEKTLKGKYTAASAGGNITFKSSLSSLKPEPLLNYSLNADKTNLSFSQKISLSKGDINLTFSKMVKK